MAISAQDVNKLRKMTGAGMMDCKKALNEANGNFEEAVVILRKKGQKVSAKRADKAATEGSVFLKTTEDGTQGVLIALNCETDFVAKNEEFVGLGEAIANAALENNPADKEALLALELDGQKIGEKITDFIGKIGEKIEITAFDPMKGDKVVTYKHSNAKIGVIMGLEGVGSNDVEEVGKDITMQIAAMRPVALDENGVDPAIVEREIEIGKEQARAEGKPEQIIEKIAMGKLKKFYKENTLLHQQFVKDNSKSIAQLLKEVSPDLKITAFKRFEIGA